MDREHEILQALRDLVDSCTASDSEPNSRGEMRTVRTPDWQVVDRARHLLATINAELAEQA